MTRTCPTSELVAGEAPVRFATTAPIKITLAARDSLLVLLQGFQN